MVDPYEVEQAVIEPPRQPAVAEEPSLRHSMTDLPTLRAGLGAEPSSLAMDLEEGLRPAGDYCQLVADLHEDITCSHWLQLSATPKYSTGCTSKSSVPNTDTNVELIDVIVLFLQVTGQSQSRRLSMSRICIE